MIIKQYLEEHGQRFELTLNPKHVETASDMQLLSEEDKDEIKEVLKYSLREIILILSRVKVREKNRKNPCHG